MRQDKTTQDKCEVQRKMQDTKSKTKGPKPQKHQWQLEGMGNATQHIRCARAKESLAAWIVSLHNNHVK